MTEPLSREARGLLEQAVNDEGALRADAARRARLKQALLSGVAASSAGLVAGTTEAAVGVKAASGALSLVKGLAVGLLVSGGIAGGFRLALSGDTEASPATLASSATASARAEPPKLAEVAPPAEATLPVAETQAPTAPAGIDASAPRARAALSADAVEPVGAAKPADSVAPALRAELQLMSEVQAALRDNSGARALTLIERYDGAFPQGQLRGERLAAEVFAACQVGSVARAQRTAAQFLSRDSSSPLAQRVKGACINAEQGR
ncbi:MAG TPA: hypothetical protein VHP33_24610 [Polyangiaceae bacterium]|nr:hypothetical protein [Polyangiaceae bacterium]